MLTRHSRARFFHKRILDATAAILFGRSSRSKSAGRRGAKDSGLQTPPARKLLLEALEPRILLSADLNPLGSTALSTQPEMYAATVTQYAQDGSSIDLNLATRASQYNAHAYTTGVTALTGAISTAEADSAPPLQVASSTFFGEARPLLGSQMAGQGFYIDGANFGEGAVDDTQLTLEAGQTLQFTAHPNGAQTRLGLEVYDADDNLIASAQAAPGVFGARVTTDLVSTGAGGVFTFRIINLEGDAPSYVFADAYLNTAFEPAPSNAGVIDISETETALPNGGSRMGALGFVYGGKTDRYEFTLDAGQSFTLAATGRDDMSSRYPVKMKLFNSSGEEIARGVSGALNVDQVISNITASASGVYTVEISAEDYVSYGFGLFKGVSYEADRGDLLSDPVIIQVGAGLTPLGAGAPDFATATQVTERTPWLGPSGTAVGGFINGRFQYDIAVVGGSYAQALVDQINASSLLPLRATLVSPTDLTTSSALGAYRLVVLSGSYGAPTQDDPQGDDAFAHLADMGAALKDWVQYDGGSVVTLGRAVLGANGAYGLSSDLDAVIPVDALSPLHTGLARSMTTVSAGNPITAGLGLIDTFGNSDSAPADPDAQVLALTDDGHAGVVAKQFGLGRTVFLAPDYGDQGNSGNLRSGDADRLLQQALVWALGSQSWDSFDDYVVYANQGDEITVDASVLGLAEGLPTSQLQLNLLVDDPNKNFVASASGGDTAQLTFTASETGAYVIRVYAGGNGTGTYQVRATGATGESPLIASIAIANNSVVNHVDGVVRVDFSAPIDLTSVSRSAFLFDGQEASDVIVIDGDTLGFVLPETPVDGDHEIVLADGYLRSVDGRVFGGGGASFRLDATPPRVTGSTVAPNDVLEEEPLTLQVAFSEDIDPARLSTTSAGLFNTTTGDFAWPTTLTYDAGSRIMTIAFADELIEGQYLFVLYSDVRDFAGNLVDGYPNDTFPTGDGREDGQWTVSFSVDTTSRNLTPLPAVGAEGGLVHEKTLNRSFGAPSDVDDFVLTLEPDARLSLALTPSSNVAARLELLNANGDVVATADSVGPGDPVYLDYAGAGGEYTLRAVSINSIGGYSITAALNARIVAEGAPVALDASPATIAGFPAPMSAIGDISSDADVDDFTVALQANQSLDIALAQLDGGAQFMNLSLTDASGVELARGASNGSNNNQFIGRFVAASAGVYTIKVSVGAGQSATRYAVTAAIGEQLENAYPDAIEPLTSQVLFGRMEAGAQRVGGVVRVAIHGLSSDSRAIQVRDQLNDSTTYDFQASIVDVSQMDTLAELQQFDVVILGNEGVVSQLDRPGFADALKQFVLNGGGVVATGFTIYAAGTATPPSIPAIDDILPVNSSGGYGYNYTTNITFAGTSHPITDGVASFITTPVENPASGLDAGATLLGYANGRAAMAAGAYGRGHGVYLGVPFADSFNSSAGQYVSGNSGPRYADLRQGAPDRLFEQAVNWAARKGDIYTVQLAAGQTLTVSTALPGEAAGDPLNTLDPILELFDATNKRVAFNDNVSAGDRNSLLTFTAPAAGLYHLSVGAVSGDGDYILSSNVASAAAPLTVVKTSIPDGARLGAPPSLITVDFSGGILSTSAQASALKINGQPAQGVVIVDGDTLAFDVTGLAASEGGYTISFADGALLGLDGRPLAGFTSTFIYDVTPPQVLSITPAFPVAPFNKLLVKFDGAIDASTVEASDIRLTTPDGSVAYCYEVSVDGDTATFNFYSYSRGGSYQVEVGPNVKDIAGNAMAATYSGSFLLRAPDLVVTNVSATPPGVFGQPYTISYTVTNIGDAPISSASLNAWQDRIDLSTDATRGYDPATDLYDIQFTDIPINDYRNGATLDPGQSYTRTVTLNLPLINQPVASGQWHFIVTPNIYYGGPVESRSDNNSFAAGPTQINLPPLADLQVADAVAPASGYFGQTVTIDWNDFNAGDAVPGANWTDQVYFSYDENLDYYDQTLASLNVPQANLAGGAKAAQSVSVTIPYDNESDPGRTYYLIIKTDAGNSVYEHRQRDENNVVALPITLQLPPRLDLRVDSTTLPSSSAVFGTSIDVTYTVANHGAGTVSGGWKDVIFLTDQPDGYGSWLKAVDITGETLGAGQSYTRTVSVELPLSHSYNPGQWYIRVESDVYNQVFEYQAEENNSGARVPVAISDPPLPDLRVENLVAPANALAGQTIQITYDTVNRGTGAAESDWYERIYLSYGDNVIDYTDRVMTQLTNGGPISLAPGGALSRVVNITLPLEPSFIAGNYSIIVAADLPAFISYGASAIYEPNGHETDNIASSPLSVAIPPLPDLTVTALSELPEAISGQRVPITWTITNSGTASVTGWIDTIALSGDAVAGNDLILSTVTYDGTLAPGQSVTQTVEVLIPETVSGSYRLVVTTDADNRYYEYPNEANNARVAGNATSITLKPFPNLVVTDVAIPSTGQSSQPINISWTVENIGDGATSAPYWYDYVYLSNNESLDNGDVLLGRVDNPSYLAPGESYASNLTALLPRGIEGARYVIIATDRENHVFEFGHEGDNLRASASINIALTPPPNLQVTRVVAPTNAVTGDPLEIVYDVTNTGETRTYESQWIDRLYMSSDETFDGSDLYLGQFVRNGALGAGETSTARVSVVPPVGYAGSYRFIVVADAASQVYEGADESDNSGASGPTNVAHRPPPDLATSIVSAPSAALAGHTVSVTYRVDNNGIGATPNYTWYDRLYLSEDATLDAGDESIGFVRINGPLESGAGYTATLSGKLPSFVGKDYYLIVASDSDREVFEFNDANNIVASALRVSNLPADLTATVDAPAAGVAGRPIRVNWTVTNTGLGSTSASTWYDRVVLSANDIAGDGDDYTLADVLHTGEVAVGASYQGTATFNLPYWALGNYNILVRSDVNERVDETNESNNAGADAIVIAREVPDLIVTAVSAPPASNVGDMVNITYTVRNAGNLATPQNYWYDRVYIADGAGLNFLSPVLATVRHANALAPDGTYTASVSVKIPESLATGDYSIYVTTDIYNDVLEEPLETNNTGASATFRVTAQPPKVYDLEVTSVDAADQGVSGQLLSVTWTVRNNGSDLSGSWYDIAYLSVDQNLQRSGDIYLGAALQTRTVLNGESYTVTQTFQIPKGFAGPYYVFIVSDSTNAVQPELSEANNFKHDPSATLISLAQPADLIVGDFSIPSDLPLGVSVDLTYSVQNNSDVAAVGSWYDSLYLSSDGNWDIGDKLIGRVLHRGGAPAQGSYSETLRGVLPGVTPGDYRVIVRTDIRNLLPETDETNNIRGSLDAANIDVPALTLAQLASGVIPDGGGSYYKLDVAAGQTLRLTLDGADAGAGNEIYVRYGAMAGRGSYDFSSAKPFEEDQSIVIPTSRAGTYYIYVVNATPPSSAPTRAFTLLAESIPYSITGVEQATVGNSFDATLRIDGALFTPDMTLRLVSADDQALDAAKVVFVNASRVYATFNMYGTPAGVYSIEATRADGSTTILQNGLTVIEGKDADIETSIDGPVFVLARRINNVNFYWKNTGDVDTMAPLIRVRSIGLFGLNGGDMRTGLFLALGSSPEGPADVLAPGEQHSASFVFASGAQMNFETVSESSGQPITDWNEIQAAFKPASLTDAQWIPFWNRIQSGLGDANWGDLTEFVNRIALEVNQPGEALRDIRVMFERLYAQSPNYAVSVTASGVLSDSQTGDAIGGMAIAAYRQTANGLVFGSAAVTAADGSFTFAGLVAGSYVLRLDPASDLVFDQDLDARIDTTAPGFSVTNSTGVAGLSLFAVDEVTQDELNQNSQPILITDPEGVSHVFWIRNDTYWHAYFNGTAWVDAAAVPGVTGSQFAMTSSNYLIDGTQSGLVLTWVQQTPGDDNSADIYYTIGVKVAGVLQWSAPAKVAQNNVADKSPSVVVDNSGRIIIAYRSIDASKPDDFDIYYAIIDTNGESYTFTSEGMAAMQALSDQILAATLNPEEITKGEFEFKISVDVKKSPIAQKLGIGVEGSIAVGVAWENKGKSVDASAKLAAELAIDEGSKIGGVPIKLVLSQEGEYSGTWVAEGCDDPYWALNSARITGKFGFGVDIAIPIETFLVGLNPVLAFVKEALKWAREANVGGIDVGLGVKAGVNVGARWNQPEAPPVDRFLDWDSGKLSFTAQINPKIVANIAAENGVTIEYGGELNFEGSLIPLGEFSLTGASYISIGGAAVGLPGDAIKIPLSSSTFGSSSVGPSGLQAADAEPITIVRSAGYGVGSALDYSGGGASALESNVAGNLTADGEVKLVRNASGQTYAAWLGGTDNADPAQQAIKVALFTGAGWSTPIALAGTAGATGDFSAAFDASGKLVIVWSELTAAPVDLSSGVVTQELMEQIFARQASTELFYGVFDGAAWSGAAQLASVPLADTGVKLGLAGGELVAAWRNGAYGVEQSSVYSAVWNGASWTAPRLVAAGAAVNDLSVGSVAGQATIFWSEDINPTELLERNILSSSFNGSDWSAKASFAPPMLAQRLGAEQIASLSALQLQAQSAPATPSSFGLAEAIFGPPDREEPCEEKEPPKTYAPIVLGSIDPNDIIGPAGAGAEKWVRADDALSYRIRFENADFATAPAKVVTITQTLDPDLDIRTFRVDDFGWSGMDFAQAGDRAYFVGRIDLSASKGYMVDVLVIPDQLTNTITWTFTTIDPATGESVEDALAGFLPPNDEDGIGEGYVSYTIKAKSNLASGAVIDAKATIVFDINEPIETPAIFNTLDVGKPSSAVNALPVQTEALEFEVSWGGQDDAGGSAIAMYDVYYRQDAGDWLLFQQNTTNTSALFAAAAGYTYSFYSIATDIAGYREDAPLVADATIQVGGVAPAEIDGFVFEDMNGDGLFGSGESGIAGRTVFLDANANGALDAGETSTTTGANGAYAFTNLVAGGYRVVTTAPAGASFTTSGGGARSIDVDAGDVIQAAPFGLFYAGSISGVVFADVDGDGVKDLGEGGVAGRVVYLDADNDGALDGIETIAMTGSDGSYQFDGLGAGTYRVREFLPANIEETTPAGGVHLVNATSGMAIAGRDFGNLSLGSVSGVSFEDLNGDGVRQSGEYGLPGWTVFLDADGDGVLDAGEKSTTTAADGSYVIADVRPGTYAANQLPPAGWIQTSGAASSALTTFEVTTSGSSVPLSSPDAELAGTLASPANDAAWASLLSGLAAYRNDPRFAGVDGAGTTVAIIDTGIDVDSAFFGADLDQNGVSDRIVYQYDFADRDGDASDRSGHGSNVSSIVAGSHAIYGGVAPGADIAALKVFSDSGTGTFAAVELALQWVVANAASRQISVVNLSLGDGADWTTASSRYGLGDEFAALASQGVIVVAAAGNGFYSFGSEPGVSYPASDPSVLAVGAVWSGDYGGPWRFSNGAVDTTTGADHIASFSQRGDQIDAFAPGARLTGANATGGLSTMQGTSQASAYFAGVAALAQDLAKNRLGRLLTPQEFVGLVRSTSDLVVDGDDENDNVRNNGAAYPRVDVEQLANAIWAMAPSSSSGGGAPSSGGQTPSSPVRPQSGQTVTVGAGEAVTGIDFANFRLGSVSGFVRDDLNRNGAADAGENGLAGRTVFLDADNDGVLGGGERSTITAADGSFSFVDIGPGAIHVREIVPAGSTETARFGADFAMTSGLAAQATFLTAPLNRAPVATADFFQVAHGQTLNVSAAQGVLANDSDADGDALAVSLVSGPAQGSLTLNADGSFSYTPAPGFAGADNFTYRVSDGFASSVATASINVTNAGPVAAADSYRVAQAGTLTAPASNGVLKNDSDADGDALTVTSFTQPARGTLTLNADGSFVYRPASNFVGTDSFTYQASDGIATSTATVTLTVVANRAPVAVADLATTDEDTVFRVAVLANDTDADGDALTVTGLPAVSTLGATLTLNGDGAVSYDPRAAAALQRLAPGQTISDSFTYRAIDPLGASSGVVTAKITVTGVNDAPVAVDDSFQAAGGYRLGVSLIANDRDVDAGAVLRIVPGSLTTTMSNVGGALTLNANGTVSYDARSAASYIALAAGETATDVFSYIVEDQYGAQSTAFATFTAVGVNDKPVAAIDAATIDEDSTIAVNVLGNDVDPDTGETATLAIAGLPATSRLGAQLSVVDGKVVYDPRSAAALQRLAAGQTASDSFTYRAVDTGGASSATITVTVNVNGLNDAPVAVDDAATTFKSTPITIVILANDIDVDQGATRAIVGFAATSASGARITQSGDRLIYDPRTSATLQALPFGQSVVDSFTYVMTDGTATSTATVRVVVTNPANRAPVASADAVTTNEDAVATIAVLANDSDPDTGATLAISGLPAISRLGAVLSIDAGGAVKYDPRAAAALQKLAIGDSATDSFTYRAIDQYGALSAAVTVTITVNGVNDAPVAANDAMQAANGVRSGVSLLVNDKDPDAGAILKLVAGSVVAQTGGLGGTLTVNADGVASYDATLAASYIALAQGESGLDVFTYMVADQYGATSTATVTVTAIGKNDRPVANSDSASTSEDSSTSIDVLANDSDPDYGAVLSIAYLPAKSTLGATLTIVNGRVVYDPTASVALQGLKAAESAVDTFSYHLTDEFGVKVVGTASITVKGRNDAPVAIDDRVAVSSGGVATLRLEANDKDPDKGAVLRVVGSSLPATTAQGALLTLNGDGSVRYDANAAAAFIALPAGATMTDSFTYSVTDADGATSTATAILTVTGRNDRPVAAADQAATRADQSLVIAVLANDSDPDAGQTATLAVASIAARSARGASLILNADGTVVYDPTGSATLRNLAAGQTLTDTFSYIIRDAVGATSTATVTVTITGTRVSSQNVGAASVASAGLPPASNLPRAETAFGRLNDAPESDVSDAADIVMAEAARLRRVAGAPATAAETASAVRIDLAGGFSDFAFQTSPVVGAAFGDAGAWKADLLSDLDPARLSAANKALRVSAPSSLT